MTNVALFGVVGKYAVCPISYHELTEEEAADPDYRARVDDLLQHGLGVEDE